jgi:hypothetical protein
VYESRPVRFLRREGQMKVYGIAAHGERPRDELVQAALTEMSEQGPGFAIIHDAADHCFVLIHWWANENEVHQRILESPLGDPAALRPLESPAIGCVWELEVTDFERRAWLEHVLKRDDLAAYLAARLALDEV